MNITIQTVTATLEAAASAKVDAKAAREANTGHTQAAAHTVFHALAAGLDSQIKPLFATKAPYHGIRAVYTMAATVRARLIANGVNGFTFTQGKGENKVQLTLTGLDGLQTLLAVPADAPADAPSYSTMYKAVKEAEKLEAARTQGEYEERVNAVSAAMAGGWEMPDALKAACPTAPDLVMRAMSGCEVSETAMRDALAVGADLLAANNERETVADAIAQAESAIATLAVAGDMVALHQLADRLVSLVRESETATVDAAKAKRRKSA